MDDMTPDDVELLLARQEQALLFLEEARAADPLPLSDTEPNAPTVPPTADPRRESLRQPVPPGVALELHDGKTWQPVPCDDIGVGGARVSLLPEWAAGPTPARLRAAPARPRAKPMPRPAALCLSDIMWRDTAQGTAGLRFEFLSAEEQALWAACLSSDAP